MAVTAQQAPHVARQRPDIGTLAAMGFEYRLIAVGAFHERKLENIDRAGFEADGLAVARDVVGALAGDLDGGELRRHLRDAAGEVRQQRTDRPPVPPRLARRAD